MILIKTNNDQLDLFTMLCLDDRDIDWEGGFKLRWWIRLDWTDEENCGKLSEINCVICSGDIVNWLLDVITMISGAEFIYCSKNIYMIFID